MISDESGARVRDAGSAGIDAVVPCSVRGGELLTAIETACTTRPSPPEPHEEATPLVMLSPRQLQVVRLVVEGLSNDEIGAALGIASKTVEAHLTLVYQRLELQGRVELTALALRSGWFGPATDPDADH